MTGSEPSGPAAAPSRPPAAGALGPYSPEQQTALVLTGAGTAGAYHAGVLRALEEAGVKIDIVGAHGVGVIGGLFAAVDGAHRLWDDKGLWRSRSVSKMYGWAPSVRMAAGALALAGVAVAVPILAVALGLLVYPIDLLAKMAGLQRAGGPVAAYLGLVQAAFAPEALPTWLPRIVFLLLSAAAVPAAVVAWRGVRGRRARGRVWWRLVPPPLSAARASALCWTAMWDLVRGATRLRQPPLAELGRRYVELVGENLGQPGFKELLLVVHDVDARRDLVFALVAEPRRRSLVRRSTTRETEERRAEVFDLSGLARDHLADVVAGALALPVASEPGWITFGPDTYWRGETHRLCDRPGSLVRVLHELIDLGAGQIVLASAAPDLLGPHALTPPRLDGRGRVGEYLQSAETAAVREAARLVASAGARLFIIRPAHNPVGPLDFAGAFDDRSDRRSALDELMARGYQDAYEQFIEPVVGASGEGVGGGS